MKLYIITKEPFPNGMAATNRIKCLAKAYLSQGVDCKVIVFSRNFINLDFPGIGVFEGIPYEYVGGFTKRAIGFLFGKVQSFILQIRFLLLLKKRLNANDIVYAFLGTKNLIRKIMIGIVHNRKAYYISELCEYPFGTGLETRLSIKRRQYALSHLFPRFDGVVAISDTLVQLAKAYCSSKCSIVKVPILVDFNQYNLPDTSKDEAVPYIFHSGTLSEQKDGILGMIEAFGLAMDRLQYPIRFILTGKMEQSPHHFQIQQLIDKYKLQNSIIFTGYLSNEDLQKYLSKASLVILNKYPTQQNQYCFSTKLGEYLAAGKPVIITKVGEAMNWLTDKKNAYIIEPYDVELLSNTIVHAYENEKERRMIGDNAKVLCKKVFDYHNYGKLLGDMVLEMIKTNQ